MKTLYIECRMGIAGDMLTSALVDLFDDKEKVVQELNGFGIPKVKFIYNNSVKCGINGSHISVLVDGEEEESLDIPNGSHEHSHNHDHHEEHQHHHGNDEHKENHHHHDTRTIDEINEIISGINISENVKINAKGVYEILARAESKVHGKDIKGTHFHEVGHLDAIADITAACYLIDKLGVEKIVISSINVGSGQVKCAHGILPVPAPATALILEGVPSYSSERIHGELCTPTGAALAVYFADEFGSQPLMRVSRTGYGMGNKDFDQANCVRAMLGECSDVKKDTGDLGEHDTVAELSCNIDDMTAEEIGFATEALFNAGALDIFTISADMKKNRPGHLLTVLCKIEDRDAIIRAIFENTTTIGIREKLCDRYILSREIKKFDTPYGEMRAKVSKGYGVERIKPEYDDLVFASKKSGKPILDVKKEVEGLFSSCK